MNFDSLVNRILKIVAVLALISLAACVAFDGHHHVTWHWHVGAILVISLCLLGSYWLVKGPVDLPDAVYCPRCHTIGRHPVVSSYLGAMSPMAHHFGGFLFSIFYSASRKQTFKCAECGEKFKAHTNTSRAYNIMYLLMLGSVANFFWALLGAFFR